MRLLALIPALLGLATPLLAQPPCAPRTLIIEKLERQFGEAPRSIGLTANGRMIEVFSSAESGTWTILMTRADGTSCLMASGSDFEMLPEALRDTPA